MIIISSQSGSCTVNSLNYHGNADTCHEFIVIGVARLLERPPNVIVATISLCMLKRLSAKINVKGNIPCSVLAMSVYYISLDVNFDGMMHACMLSVNLQSDHESIILFMYGKVSSYMHIM